MRDKVTVKKVFVKCMSVFAVLLALQMYANKFEYVNTYAAEDEEDLNSPISGVISDSIAYHYENGVITITGEGKIEAINQYGESDILFEPTKYDALGKRLIALKDHGIPPKLVIGEGITEIGKNAFGTCTYFPGNGTAVKYYQSFSSVVLPKSLTVIGEAAFYDQVCMTGVNLHSGIITIGKEAFRDCENLDKITLFGNTEYGERCFENCGVTSVVIPASLEKMGKYMFEDCKKLSSLTIEEGVKDLNNNAFKNCEALKNVVIPSTIEKWESTFAYSGLEEVSISNGVKTIGNYVFYNCSNLRTVNMPDSLISTGDYSFMNCESLEGINLPERLASIGTDGFAYCVSLNSVKLPDKLTSLEKYAFSSCYSLQEISIPEGITDLSDSSFWNCYNLKTIYLPETLTNLGGYCFYVKEEDLDSGKDLQTDVYFGGSESDWNKVITTGSDFRNRSVTMHYGKENSNDNKDSSSSGKKSSSSSEKDSSSSSDRKDDSSSSDRDNSSSSYYPIDETVPETGSLVEATVRSAVADESGAPILQSVEATSYVTYNGKKHTLSSLAKTKKLSGDIDVRVYGDVLNYANPTYKFKNNKDVSEKKQPYFTLSFKAIKGVATPAQKKYIKALNKELKNQRVYFEIKPANLNKARVESSKANKRKTKLTTLKISIGSNTFKLGKKDYTLRAMDGGFEVTGKGNFTGTLFVTP